MILIATHHKTGTVWMLRVFQEIARLLDLKLCQLQSGFVADADIYLTAQLPFPPQLLERDFRGLHLIRDPRDIILSGMNYHRWSKEAWLHAPRPNLDGDSYQTRLLSLDGDEQLYFEMNEAGRWTIGQMLEWDYDDPRFFEAKYEDLISPTGTDLFSQILQFLGIEGENAAQSLEIFRQNSLSATGFAKPDDRHVRSGRSRQWPTEYRRRHGRRFVEILGNCLIRLGYEEDNDWVDQLTE